jgi:hypothetical protein
MTTKTYSTLSPDERALVTIPANIEDVDVEYAKDDRAFAINITHAIGSKVLIAKQVGDTDSYTYDVSIDIWAPCEDGEVRYTQTVAFTTTKAWIEEWMWMAQAHMPRA